MLQTDNKVILLWGNSILAKRTARVLVRIGIVATMTVGGMAAFSHPVNAAYTLPYAVDVAVESRGILLFKSKDGVSLGK